MSTVTLWTLAALAGLGTFLLRLSFLALVRGDSLPDGAARALRLVPAAALAALAAPSVFPAAELAAGDPARPLAAAAAALIAWRTRNMFATLAAGMAVLWLLRWVI